MPATRRSFLQSSVASIAGLATLQQQVPSGPTYDVRRFGALGDGNSDDTGAFQRAAAAASQTGGTIIVPRGLYMVTQIAIGGGGVLIAGEGPGASIVKRNHQSIGNGDANNSGAVIFVNAALAGRGDVTAHLQFAGVRDLTIDGNAEGNPGVTNANLGCHGFRANYTDFLFLENVELTNCIESGAYYFGCARTRTVACIAHRNGQLTVPGSRNGFSVTGPKDSGTPRGVQDEHVFVGCLSHDNREEGITVSRNGRVIVADCILHHNDDQGLEGDTAAAATDATDAPAGWVVTGCHIYNNRRHGIGISNSNVQRVLISNNIVEGCGGCGIATSFASGSLASIVGNIVRDWGSGTAEDHGIVLGAFDHAVVSNNILDAGEGTKGSGIVFLRQAEARHVSIANNVIWRAGGGGMSLTGSLTGTVVGNAVAGAGLQSTNGLAIQATTGGPIVDLLVAGNVVTDAAARGFFVRAEGPAEIRRVRFLNNVARANGTYGMAFANDSGKISELVFAGNDLAGNGQGNIAGLTPAMVASFETSAAVSSDRGDTDVTLSAGTDAPTQRFATALSADRRVVLEVGFRGASFRIVRSGGGPFSLDVGGLKTIPSDTAAFVDVQHDGDAWRLVAYGRL